MQRQHAHLLQREEMKEKVILKNPLLYERDNDCCFEHLLKMSVIARNIYNFNLMRA